MNTSIGINHKIKISKDLILFADFPWSVPWSFQRFFARLEIRIASAADPETSKNTSELLSAVGVCSSRYLI